MNGTLESIVQPYTYASPEQIGLLSRLVQALDSEGIPGDIVECGVFNGGSAAILAHFAAKSRFNRRVWLFDSFEGLPAPTEKDGPSSSGQRAEAATGACKGDINAVKRVLELVDADMSRVNIVKGWYTDTFPAISISQIAMLSLDSDWYEAEKLCIEKFYPSVVPGGIIYSDDFFWWPGCQRAITEFFDNKSKPLFNRVPSMWMQK